MHGNTSPWSVLVEALSQMLTSDRLKPRTLAMGRLQPEEVLKDLRRSRRTSDIEVRLARMPQSMLGEYGRRSEAGQKGTAPLSASFRRRRLNSRQQHWFSSCSTLRGEIDGQAVAGNLVVSRDQMTRGSEARRRSGLPTGSSRNDHPNSHNHLVAATNTLVIPRGPPRPTHQSSPRSPARQPRKNLSK